MSVWRAIKLLLTLKCDESTRLVSESFERDLTGVERWAVRLHSISCGACRQLKKQLSRLQEIGQQFTSKQDGLSGDAKERIASQILDASDN